MKSKFRILEQLVTGFRHDKIYGAMFGGKIRTKYSTRDFMELCRVSDPRSSIRFLRDEGVPIEDEWQSALLDGEQHKFKVYYLNNLDFIEDYEKVHGKIPCVAQSQNCD